MTEHEYFSTMLQFNLYTNSNKTWKGSRSSAFRVKTGSGTGSETLKTASFSTLNNGKMQMQTEVMHLSIYCKGTWKKYEMVC